MNFDPNQPFFSVIIPVYNAEKTIIKCIDSIFPYQDDDLEILICDDASIDDSQKKLLEIKRDYSAVKLFFNKTNFGAGYCRNMLLANAKGRYVAFLDADDFWYPGYLLERKNILTKRKIDILTSDYEILSENGQVVGRRQTPKNLTFFKMHLANWLPTSFTVVKTSLLGALHMQGLKRRQDYAYWLSLFGKNKGLKYDKIDKVSGAYTRSKQGLSHSKVKNIRANFVMWRFGMKYNIFLSFLLVLINSVMRIFRT